MSLPIIWQPDAADELVAIASFIAHHDDHAALGLVQRIELAAMRLADQPYMAAAGRVQDTRELVVHPNYIVVYQLTAAAGEILAVLHAASSIPETPQDALRAPLWLSTASACRGPLRRGLEPSSLIVGASRLLTCGAPAPLAGQRLAQGAHGTTAIGRRRFGVFTAGSRARHPRRTPPWTMRCAHHVDRAGTDLGQPVQRMELRPTGCPKPAPTLPTLRPPERRDSVSQPSGEAPPPRS